MHPGGRAGYYIWLPRLYTVQLWGLTFTYATRPVEEDPENFMEEIAFEM